MNDLVDRRAAIDDLHEKDPSQVWDTADVEVWVNALPSAQPEPCEDAVSRAKINSFCHEIIRRDPMGNNDVVQAFESFRAYVNSLPSVQPERKKGRWERHNTYHGDDTSGFIDPDWKCSECGRQANVNEWFMYDLTDFCPNCGADMRGAEDEQV